MTSPNRFFRMKSVEFAKVDEGPIPAPPRQPEPPRMEFDREPQLQNKDLDFSSVTSTGQHLSCSAKTHQALRMIGYDNNKIRDTLHAVDVLKKLANRPIETVVFSSIRERNRLGLGAMASIASICNMNAADVGVTLRSAARFYARHKKEVDIDEMERFVKWLTAKGEKGEVITGMPSEWEDYSRMAGRKVVRSNIPRFKSAPRKKGMRSAPRASRRK